MPDQSKNQNEDSTPSDDGIGGALVILAMVGIPAAAAYYTNLSFTTVWRLLIVLIVLSVIYLFIESRIESTVPSEKKLLKSFLLKLSQTGLFSIVCAISWLFIASGLVPRNDGLDESIFSGVIGEYLSELSSENISRAGPAGIKFRISGPILIVDTKEKTIHPANAMIPKSIAARSLAEVETIVFVSDSWSVVGSYNAGLDGNRWHRPGSTPALRHKYSIQILKRSQKLKWKYTRTGPDPSTYIESNYITGDKYQIVKDIHGGFQGVAYIEKNQFKWLVSKIEELSDYKAIDIFPFQWR